VLDKTFFLPQIQFPLPINQCTKI